MSSLFWAVIFRALDAFFRGIVLHVLRFFGEALVQKAARVFGEIMGAGAKVVAKAGLSLSLACMLSVLPVVNSPALATSGAESSAENLTAALPAGLYTRAVIDERGKEDTLQILLFCHDRIPLILPRIDIRWWKRTAFPA